MKSCLIVDDSRVVRKVIRRIIEEFTFDCEEAEDGQKAYEACLSKMPDLIMLDWNMPVMNGIEFLGKLREMDGGDHPKVIFCTTENGMDHIQRAIGDGADEYIMKPFDSDVIKAKLIQVGLLETE
jgi:two-component system chemotaxis response regulator CheY